MKRAILFLFLFLQACGAQVPVPAPTVGPFKFALKGVWYRSYRGSWLAEMADTGSDANVDAVGDMVQNFQAIKAMGANVVVLRLMDDDDWAGQSGGGATYNPIAHPRAVVAAEKLMLDTADAVGLRVVFTIEPSSYHRYSVDADDGVPDATAYINQFNPDPRVLGWLMHDESDPSNPAEQAWLTKYWDAFYERYHSATTWVGINMIYTPDFTDVSRALIDSSKKYFAARKHRPDMWGMEWFASTAINTASSDIHSLVGWMAADVYAVPRSQIAFLSGGSESSWDTFYPVAIEQMATEQIAGLFAWAADGYQDGNCASSDSDTGFNLFQTTFIAATACKTFVTGETWHWQNQPNTWTLETSAFPTQYGRFSYTGLTVAGQSLSKEFQLH